MPTILSCLIFLTVIKPVVLSYMCSYLAGLHSKMYCVGLVVNLPIVLRRLFLNFLAIHDNLSDSIKPSKINLYPSLRISWMIRKLINLYFCYIHFSSESFPEPLCAQPYQNQMIQMNWTPMNCYNCNASYHIVHLCHPLASSDVHPHIFLVI